MKFFNGMTLRYWGFHMDKLNGKEYSDLSPFQKEMVLLSIKYQMDLMIMPMKDVKNLISKEDWEKVQRIMKYGKEIH